MEQINYELKIQLTSYLEDIGQTNIINLDLLKKYPLLYNFYENQNDIERHIEFEPYLLILVKNQTDVLC
jgi:hypothetical protein